MKPNTHDILPRMQRELNAAGINAHDTVYGAGLYYDGTQHGELIPCVFICNERDITGIASETVRRIIEKHLRHTDYVCIRDWHQFHDIFRVVKAEDATRGEALQNVADAFLAAFWQAIHADASARDNNAEKAIRAGHAALAALA